MIHLQSVISQELQFCSAARVVERLWRDVWTGVTSQYYNELHVPEEEGLLDLTSFMRARSGAVLDPCADWTSATVPKKLMDYVK
uniref:Integrase core domain-containing protein n=1 Tax=Knipowitschia caucasica TaxID=637954 RepID=A0AAV2MS07_KNICA